MSWIRGVGNDVSKALARIEEAIDFQRIYRTTIIKSWDGNGWLKRLCVESFRYFLRWLMQQLTDTDSTMETYSTYSIWQQYNAQFAILLSQLELTKVYANWPSFNLQYLVLCPNTRARKVNVDKASCLEIKNVYESILNCSARDIRYEFVRSRWSLRRGRIACGAKTCGFKLSFLLIIS